MDVDQTPFIPPRPFRFITTIYRTIKSLLQLSNFPECYFSSESVRSAQSYLRFPRTVIMRCWIGFCPCEKSYCGEEIVVESITRNTCQSSRIWSYFQKLVYIGWCLLFLGLAWKVRKTFNKLLGVSNLTADSCFCDEMLAFLIHALASECFSKEKKIVYSQIIFI